MEKIVEIQDLDASKGMDGFVIVTDEQEIILGINNQGSCCESWGHFWCNDNPQEFVGATVHDVTITNNALITEKAPDVYEGGVMFVNIVTDRGVLQFVAYNSHNGYYSHSATVECKQLNHSEYL